MRNLIAAALPLFGLLPAPTLALAEAGPRLAQHRAVYDLSLAKSEGGSRGVESARGRIALDFAGDACEGYATKYRQVTVLESGESGTRTSDLRTTSFESADEKSFQFKTENSSDRRASETLDGRAEQRSGAVAVSLRQPKREDYTLPGEGFFPTAHMKRLIEAARAGERTASIKVFDGSDDARKVYDTLAVIGARLDPSASQPAEAPLRQPALAKVPRWPVTLSYFGPGEGERTPIYVLSFELYENGVSGALRLDYGSFALKGEVTSFEILPGNACSR
jgi:hypothetical protein